MLTFLKLYLLSKLIATCQYKSQKEGDSTSSIIHNHLIKLQIQLARKENTDRIIGRINLILTTMEITKEIPAFKQYFDLYLATVAIKTPNISNTELNKTIKKIHEIIQMVEKNKDEQAFIILLNTQLEKIQQATDADEKAADIKREDDCNKPCLPFLKNKTTDQFIMIDAVMNDSTSRTYIVKKIKFDGTFQKNKNREDNLYFLKESRVISTVTAPPDVVAPIETVSQEFLRFLAGGSQPKTRIVVTPTGETFGVVSKAIPGFKTLFELAYNQPSIHKSGGGKLPNPKQQDNILSKCAVILEFARVFKETDLHAQNIGIDQYGKPVKIDGDKCMPFFSYRQECDSLRAKRRLRASRNMTDITIRDLKNSPDIIDLDIDHWLQIIIRYKRNHEKIFQLFNPASVKANEYFQHMTQSTRLQLILLDKQLLKHFMQQYFDNEDLIEKFTAYLYDRIQLLKKEMFKDEYFVDHLLKDNGQSALHTLYKKMEHFKTVKKRPLFANAAALKTEKEKIKVRLQELCKEVTLEAQKNFTPQEQFFHLLKLCVGKNKSTGFDQIRNVLTDLERDTHNNTLNNKIHRIKMIASARLYGFCRLFSSLARDPFVDSIYRILEKIPADLNATKLNQINIALRSHIYIVPQQFNKKINDAAYPKQFSRH